MLGEKKKAHNQLLNYTMSPQFFAFSSKTFCKKYRFNSRNLDVSSSRSLRPPHSSQQTFIIKFSGQPLYFTFFQHWFFCIAFYVLRYKQKALHGQVCKKKVRFGHFLQFLRDSIITFKQLKMVLYTWLQIFN